MDAIVTFISRRHHNDILIKFKSKLTFVSNLMLAVIMGSMDGEMFSFCGSIIIEIFLI